MASAPHDRDIPVPDSAHRGHVRARSPRSGERNHAPSCGAAPVQPFVRCLCHGKHLILEEYLRANLPDAARNEYDARRQLQSLQLAPEAVFFNPSVGRVVYRYMEGEMWDRRVPSGTELRDLADVWLRLHELHTDGLWVSTGQARRWPGIVARLRASLEAYARSADGTSPKCRAAAPLCLEALERCLTAAAPLYD